MKSPILITGVARSGTSMVAGIVNICGAFKGNTQGVGKDNQKGMFENLRIRNEIIKPYLRNASVDPLCQYPLLDVNIMSIPIDLQNRVELIIQKEGYKSGDWMIKTPKLCLTYPMWHHAFPDAKWIIVRRKTSDIINSCLKTGFMRAFSKSQIQKAVGVDNERDGWLWWVRQHERRFVEMITFGLNVKIVYPERMVDGNYSQMKEAIEWLGLEWKRKEIIDFIEPKLWKAKK